MLYLKKLRIMLDRRKIENNPARKIDFKDMSFGLDLAVPTPVNADQKVHRSGGMKVLRSINTCLLQFH